MKLIPFCTLLFLATGESRWVLDRICDYDLTEEHGLLTSPNYPHSYPSSIICTYRLIQPRERILTLSLSHLDLGWNDTDRCSARLDIYDGDDDDAPRLDSLCGTNYFIPSRLINSSANALFLKLESYSSSQGIGFQALYKTTDLQCGGLFKEANGTVKHPTYGVYYKNSETCKWIVQAPPGHIINLNFTAFKTETTHDYVKISELYEGRIVDIVTLSGLNLPPPVVSRGRILYVTFHSDVSNVQTGFIANYTFVDTLDLH